MASRLVVRCVGCTPHIANRTHISDHGVLPNPRNTRLELDRVVFALAIAPSNPSNMGLALLVGFSFHDLTIGLDTGHWTNDNFDFSV